MCSPLQNALIQYMSLVNLYHLGHHWNYEQSKIRFQPILDAV